MDRAEAEAILDGDRETALAPLTRLDELIEANRRLDARVADLERHLNLYLAQFLPSALPGSPLGAAAATEARLESNARRSTRTRG